MKHSALIRALSGIPRIPHPDPSCEQVSTPPEAAAALLELAVERGDLVGRSVLDLGCGAGVLSIGAGLLGAGEVAGVDRDPAAIELARNSAEALGVSIRFEVSRVSDWAEPADTVVMNPPFGAQRRGADRVFWERAIDLARGGVYAFSLRVSRTFIPSLGVARGARIEETRPVPWELPRTFPHHRKGAVPLEVDLWVLRPGGST
jgi:putative methylase